MAQTFPGSIRLESAPSTAGEKPAVSSRKAMDSPTDPRRHASQYRWVCETRRNEERIPIAFLLPGVFDYW